MLNLLRCAPNLLLATIVFTNVCSTAQSPDSVRTELDRIVKQLNENLSWIEGTDKTLVTLGNAIAEADIHINRLTHSIIEVTREIGEIDDEIVVLQNDQKRWEALRKSQSKKIAWHVYALSLLDRRNPVMFIFGEDDRLRADRLVRHHGSLVKSGIPAKSRYESLVRALEIKTAELSNKRAQRSDTTNRLTRDREKLEQGQEQRRMLTVTLTRQLKNTRLTSVRLESDRIRLAQLLANLEKSSAPNAALPSSVNGSWPVHGDVIHRFDEPRAGGRLKWQGVFIEAEPGAAVHAIASGEVRFAGYFKGFGMAIVIDHGDGLLSVYAHCDALLKQNGDLVEAAELIAHAGQSGGLSDTGLYLELRLNDVPIDPLSWLEENEQQATAE